MVDRTYLILNYEEFADEASPGNFTNVRSDLDDRARPAALRERNLRRAEIERTKLNLSFTCPDLCAVFRVPVVDFRPAR